MCCDVKTYSKHTDRLASLNPIEVWSIVMHCGGQQTNGKEIWISVDQRTFFKFWDGKNKHFVLDKYVNLLLLERN